MNEIDNIKSVEKEVAESIEKAKKDAEDKIEQIIAERDVVVQKKIDVVEKEVSAKREEEKELAQAQSEKIIKKAESEVKKIKSVNLDKAVEVVIDEFKG